MSRRTAWTAPVPAAILAVAAAVSPVAAPDAAAASARAPEIAVAAGPAGALSGMSGLVNVPTADVLPEGALRLGGWYIPEEWSYNGRGLMHNEVYFVTVGFLPRLEVSLRATVLPEISLISLDDSPVVDRLASAKFRLRDGGSGPAVAVGVDDVRGTRLFHSLYVVVTQDVRNARPRVRVSGGFAPDIVDARLHVLDGAFGGLDVTFMERVRAKLDFDTEKWNSGISLEIYRGLSAQVVLLHLDTPAGGLAWNHQF